MKSYNERIEFPNQLAETPGSTLLFTTYLKQNYPKLLEEFLSARKKFRGLELICADCKTPYPLSDFNCPICRNSELKLKANVIEENGIEKIVPSTLRIWCSNEHNLYGYLRSRNSNFRCKRDGARLKYFLVGNERDEFLVYLILRSASDKVYHTTTYYQALLSCCGNVKEALDWLSEKGLLEKSLLNIDYARWVREPHIYKLTKEGIEEKNTLEKKFSFSEDLQHCLFEFMAWRHYLIEHTEESKEQKTQRFSALIKQLKIEKLQPELKEKLFTLLNFKGKRGIKKRLEEKLKYLENEDICSLLEKIYSNPGLIKIYRLGSKLILDMPNLTKPKITRRVIHVPKSYLHQIYKADKKHVNWELVNQLKS